MQSSQVTAAPMPLFHRKICVVGCSTAGKTSLIKSITTNAPQLVHVDDRTIGIDQYSHRFKESGTSTDYDKIHEVTFWDFAGHDAYQVAHSLFFSRRALFLVCVDLDAFANAYMQAVIRADDVFQETTLMDEFVEHSVMRWVRMIVARQPDAEFVFIGTKEDTLFENDFIRQIFDHKNTAQTLSHDDLTSLPYWKALGDAKQLKAMKQVLHKFRLVYPDAEDRVMQWDSDLIVPALWQIKTPASWKFGGDILRINKMWTLDGETLGFDAGPDWILYKDKEVAACRIMVGRDAESLHQTILVEAVVADAASIEQVEELWWTFEQLCGAFVKVLRENPGLRVSSFAWDDAKDKVSLKSLVWSRLKPSSRKWMPPIKTCERAGLISADWV